MWTAAQIFLFGTLPYLMEGNSKRLFWAGISVFVHFSFSFSLGILLLFIFIKNRINIYLAFFILTSFIKELDLQMVRSALSFLPNILQLRLTSYTDADYVQLVNLSRQSANWYLIYSSKGVGWVIYALVLFSYFFCRKFLSNNRAFMTLFCFSLLLYGCSNIFSLLPSGGRFITVASTFMFVFFVIFYSDLRKNKGSNLIIAFSIPLLLLYCVVSLRIGMDYYSLMTVIGNPIYASIFTDQIPLIEIMKKLL